MSVKKIIPVFFILFFFSSCSQKGQERMLGKWKTSDDSMFQVWTIDEKQITIDGYPKINEVVSYKILHQKDNVIQIEITPISRSDLPIRVLDLKFNADDSSFTNDTLVFKRLKPGEE